MKKNTKWCLLLIVMLAAFFFSGCSLINVNPERDNAQVIATIDGNDLTKSYYNNYLAMMQMNYETSDQQWPTGHTLKELKENLYDSIIQQQVFALKAQKDGETIDENEAKKDAEETFNNLKEELGDDQFEAILNENYSTTDTFKSWVEENQKNAEYASKTTEKFQDDFEKDPSKVLDATVGKINDTDVKRGTYEYRLLRETLNYYMENQEAMPTDQAAMEETNLKIFEDIQKADANIKYCEDNSIEVPQSDIDSKAKSLESTTSYFFQDEDQTKQFLENYYLTQDTYDTYLKEQAKGDAAQEAVRTNCEDNVEVTDSEVKAYYQENQKKYDTTEVSAMHILSEDKAAADSIYDEAKDITTKEDFQALIDKYKDVEGIDEATDLGQFDYGTMVEPFSEAAFNADLNTVLKPVKTDYGYHVIFVYDRQDGEVQPLEDVREDIENEIKTDEGEEKYDQIENDLTRGVHYDIPDEISTPIEEYCDTLKEEYNVKEDMNNIRA